MIDYIFGTTAIVLIVAGSIRIGFIFGVEAGSPTQDISEIVWVEQLPPEISLPAYDVVCEFVPRDSND